MKSKKPKVNRRRPPPILGTGAAKRMTAEQAASPKQLAQATYAPEAFSAQLTQTEAARRIATFEAKLKLQAEPPHTL
jgi:hypothetical protein